MQKVRFSTIKNSIMETRASDTEKILMGLCREEELSSVDNPDSEVVYSGLITTPQLANVLTNIKLSLNRLQVTSVMCEVEEQDGFVDYYKFVPVAARNIDIMNDPATIEKKAKLLAREQIKPEDYLKGRQEHELQTAVAKQVQDKTTALEKASEQLSAAAEPAAAPAAAATAAATAQPAAA